MSHRILVVEDNPNNLDMLTRRLQARGYLTLSAVDGAEAIEKAQHDHPDLIVMDLSLPKVSGWDASRALKADPATHDIPIIALSAHALKSDEQKALEAGCNSFQTKPVDMDQLLQEFQKFLTRDQ